MKKILFSSKNHWFRLLLSTILVFSMILGTWTIPIHAATITENVSFNVTYDQTSARNMLTLINNFRTGSDAWYWNSSNTSKVVCSNLSTLSYDYGLEQIAMQRAAEIAINWDHTRPNGGSCFTVTYSGVSANGENLAAGSSTYTAAFNLLQETDYGYSGQGHRRNMLSSNYTAVGIAHVVYNGVHYWVQEFGTKKSSVASTAALNLAKDVTIPLCSSFVSKLTRTTDVGILSVVKGKSVSVPEGKYNLIATGVWPSGSTRVISVDSTWTVKDDTIATISNGIITGKNPGQTTISTEVLGQTFTVTLNVLSKECTTHTYNDGVITLEPTCVDTGIKTFTCTNCGYFYNDEVAALDHDWSGTPVAYEGQEPTCTESGLGELYCAREFCERDSFMKWYYPNTTIPALGHNEIVDIPAKAATCTQDGTTKGSHCGRCNITMATATIVPKLNHKWTFTTYAWAEDYSNCSAFFTCENDNTHILDQGTTVTDSITKPTCTTEGNHKYVATTKVDGKDYVDEKNVVIPIDSTAHPLDKYQTVDGQDPTCEEEGFSSAVVCGACHKTITAESPIPAIGHEYKPSYTWSEDGTSCTLTLTCKNDSAHVVSDINMEIEDELTLAPTCTEEGIKLYTASYKYNDVTYTDTKEVSVSPLGHNYAPSYTWDMDAENCSMTLICTRNSSHKVTNIDMSVTSNDLLAATCSATGTRKYTANCTYNAVPYSTNKTIDTPKDSSNHPTENIEITTGIPATCTTDGYTDEKYCNACETIFEPSNTIPALGHSYEPTYTWKDVFAFDDEPLKSCTMKLTCSNDSSHVVNNIEMNVETVNIIDPTCTEDGSINYYASTTYGGVLYGDSTSDVILKLGHSYKPSYDWASDYSSCDLVLTCENDSSHIIRKAMNVTVTDENLPTCIRDGYREYTSSIIYNGKTYTDTTTEYLDINPNTHENVDIDYGCDATCTTDGYTDYIYCNDCDTVVQDEEIIPALGHNYNKKIISTDTLKSAATYDSPAIYYYSCSHCNEIGSRTFTNGSALVKPTPDVNVTYHTHIQTLGDSQGTKSNGEMAGTSGMAKRLENIWINVDGNPNLGIQYTTHCQTYGWLPWSTNGEANGTSGEAKRLEAIKIKLTGPDASKYDVYYRVHAQSYGWLGWAKNGEPSGTAGYAKRLEGIQVVIKKKGEAAPGLNYAGVNASTLKNDSRAYISKTVSTITIPGNETNPNVMYKTHVQSFGWQKWMVNGQMSGTSGMAKRLEGINIKLSNCPYTGGIRYWTHIQKYGWSQSWKYDGAMAGTSGEAKRLEAIRIELYGEMADHYDVYYRVHAQSYGWLNWAKNGEDSGTAGGGKRLEGIQIILVPKGQTAPAMTYQGITSIKKDAFIQVK